MDDWRYGDGEGIKRWLLIGAGTCIAVVAWMYFARPNDEAPSSRGFDLGSSAVAPGGSSGRIFERRGQTGLNFVGGAFSGAPSSVRTGDPPGTALAASDRAGSEGAASTRLQDAAESAGTSGEKAEGADPARLAALGVPTNKAALESLGSQHGLLSKLVDKVLGYPPAIKFLLNNKLVVNGLFAREVAQRNCRSGSALKSYMMNGSDPKGVSEDIPILKAMMKHPESAAAAVNSEFGRRVMECPSVAQLQKDPGGLTQVVLANPGLLGLVADPATIRAVSSNPQAGALLSSAQSAVGGGRP